MSKFSQWIQSPGTGGPGTFQGVKNLGFAVVNDLPAYLAKYLRVDVAQSFSAGETQQARDNIALGNVNNTSDANKPVSTATQTALNLKADLESPEFTGDPTAPTQSPGNSTTRLANTAFVAAAVSALSVPVRVGPTTLSSTSAVLAIPTTAAEIRLSLNAFKLSGTAVPLIRLRSGGAAVTTGYVSSGTSQATPNTVTGATRTDGFFINGGDAANLYTGGILLTLQNPASNTWVVWGIVELEGTTTSVTCLGKVSLPGAINGIILTSSASDTLSGSATAYAQ